MKWLGLAAAAAGCWSAPAPVTATAPPGAPALPGLVWMTERPAFRAPGAVFSLAPDGDSVVIGADFGMLVRMDLATGKVVAEKRIGEFGVWKLVRLDAASWLAVGNDNGRFRAMRVDARTLAGTPIDIAIPAEPGELWSPADAVMLPDGSVAMSGPGMPLAVFDAKTWKVKTQLAPELAWWRMSVDGGKLYAESKSAAFVFDLATGKRTSIGTLVEQAAGGRYTKRQFKDGGWLLEVVDDKGVATKIKGSTSGHLLDATRLFEVSDGILRVHDLASGQITLHVDLGPSARAGASSTLALAGGKLVVTSRSVVRVVDLATGAATPEGPPPYGEAQQLLARGDNSIGVIDRGAWWFDGGKLVASWDPHDADDVTSPPGELRRFATYGAGDNPVVTLRDFRDGRVTHHWNLPQSALYAWLASDGSIVVCTNLGIRLPARVLRLTGAGEVTRIASTASEGTCMDADVDGGRLVLAAHGAAYVMQLSDGRHAGAPLRIPGCDDPGKVVLQRGGTGILTMNDHDLVAWDGNADKPVGTLHVPRMIGAAAYMPDDSGVMFDYGHWLALWSPARRELRAFDMRSSVTAQPTTDGKRVALAFGDGRLALVELEPLRAAMTKVAMEPVSLPDACPGNDPLDVPADESDAPIDDGNDGGD